MITQQDLARTGALLLILVAGCSDANEPEIVTAGKAVIAANNACSASVQPGMLPDTVLCRTNTMAAKKKYDDARLKVTTATPASDAIQEQVMTSQMETFSTLMKKSGQQSK